MLPSMQTSGNIQCRTMISASAAGLCFAILLANRFCACPGG